MIYNAVGDYIYSYAFLLLGTSLVSQLNGHTEKARIWLEISDYYVDLHEGRGDE